MNLNQEQINKKQETLKKLKATADPRNNASDQERKTAKAKAQTLRDEIEELRSPTSSDYKEWVKEAKEILKNVERDAWRLAELAAKVDAKYGDDKVRSFAIAIGMAYKTVKNWRATAKA